MATNLSLSRPTWSLPALPRFWALAGALACLTLMGAAAGVARLLAGLGPTTFLTDSVPWGIWIGFDFALIAFAGAGFTLAAAAHVLHLHRLEPAVRPALFTGFLGYSAVLLLLVLDLGRPDRFYHFILYWNPHSPLFEISWCVLLYTTVLLIEVSPDFLGRFGWARLQQWALRLMPPVCIAGVTLSTLHQSTLGTLYVNMPHRLHPLWYTPFLPLLFFTSSVAAGLSVALLAYRLAARTRSQPEERRVVEDLASGVTGALLIFLALRGGLLWRENELPLLWPLDRASIAWWIELVAGVALPLILLVTPRLRRTNLTLWLAPLLVTAGVGLNRFNATLTAQTPPLGSSAYSPHPLEWLTTIGILAGAALVWLLAMRFLVSPAIPLAGHGSR
ncbi:MAG TPA: NrfD/PsrC family molybdoenzyme membrane anchor subunit [Caldilineaceae bacterium]|nr:NrfD/PsrC family molybdoenzyme membrane anchor subunit [Caldilineaceae bacterium]